MGVILGNSIQQLADKKLTSAHPLIYPLAVYSIMSMLYTDIFQLFLNINNEL